MGVDSEIRVLAKKVNAVLLYEGSRPETLDWDQANQALQDLLQIASQADKESNIAATVLTSLHIGYTSDGFDSSSGSKAWEKVQLILNELPSPTIQDLLTDPWLWLINWDVIIPYQIFQHIQQNRSPV